MIKINRKQEIRSVLIKDTIWDLKRTRQHEIKLFGLKIWSWNEDHTMDIDRDENKVGFKNGDK